MIMNTFKYNDWYDGSHRRHYNRSAELLVCAHTLKPDSGMQGSPGRVMLPCCYQLSRDTRGMVSGKVKGEKLEQQGKRKKKERE